MRLRCDKVGTVPYPKVPTLTHGVLNEAITHSSDLEAIYEAIGTDDKSTFWINETTSRWDGYMWFQWHPKLILEWFHKYVN